MKFSEKQIYNQITKFTYEINQNYEIFYAVKLKSMEFRKQNF